VRCLNDGQNHDKASYRTGPEGFFLLSLDPHLFATSWDQLGFGRGPVVLCGKRMLPKIQYLRGGTDPPESSEKRKFGSASRTTR